MSVKSEIRGKDIFNDVVMCYREACVNFSLSTMGSPVSMAAFTTFLAGVVLLPSRVLAYIQVISLYCLLGRVLAYIQVIRLYYLPGRVLDYIQVVKLYFLPSRVLAYIQVISLYYLPSREF